MQLIVVQDTLCVHKVQALLVALRQANASRHVLVDSPGGQFEYFSTLGPAIQRQGIVTYAGDVRSAAVILYLLGHRRQAFPGSSFFFHEVRTLVGGDQAISLADAREVEDYAREMSGRRREAYQEWLRQMEVAQAWFLRFISDNTGVPTPTFLSLMRAEATLSARDAVRYGIVHEIVSEETLRT